MPDREQQASYVKSRPANKAKPKQATSTKAKPAKQLAEKPAKHYATLDEAIRSCSHSAGSQGAGPTARYDYQNASGALVGVVLRFDKRGGGKRFAQLSLVPDGGWQAKAMPGPRPLYHLPEVIEAERVYITEGEKAAEAGRSLGLACTTSPGGANGASRADWSSMAGKECILLPDNDRAGEAYAEEVTQRIHQQAPEATVRLLRLEGLPEKGDLFDWIAAQPAAAKDHLREKLAQLAGEAELVEREVIEPAYPRYEPFPVEALPDGVRPFIEKGAEATCCDAAFIALPLLTVFGGAIGLSRQLRIKEGWHAPPILWTAIVGESGTAKTPAFKIATQAIRKLQAIALENHRQAMKDYEAEKQTYEKELAAWRKSQEGGPPPEPPEEPQATRYLVSDTTIEALAPILLANRRGVVMQVDELAGWFGGFDRYAASKGGADASKWLSAFSADDILVDRKTGDPKTIHVPCAAVCVTGGIQPGILRKCFGAENRQSGLAARFLLAAPPRRAKEWTEAGLSPADKAAIEGIVKRLLELQFEVDDRNQPQPVSITFAKEAKQLWIEAYNEHAKEMQQLSGDLAAAWSKLEEYPARIALILHYVRWASGDPSLVDLSLVDAASLRMALTICSWAKGQTKRVYHMLNEEQAEEEERQLVEQIERNGGRITARQLSRSSKQRWPTANAAEQELNELVERGVGRWEQRSTGKQGGRPTRELVLCDPEFTANPPMERPEENPGDKTPLNPGIHEVLAFGTEHDPAKTLRAPQSQPPQPQPTDLGNGKEGLVL